MSKADELLNSLSDEDISLQLVNPETEPHIVIGDDRIVSVPKELQRIAVQYDHDVETVTFDCPRYWDGLDMSKMNIYVNYMRKDRYIDSYKTTDIAVDTANPNIMHFNWTISRNVSKVSGGLKFLVCIKKSDAEGSEINHWNSELNNEMYISEGLEADPSILDPYPDIISQWENEVNDIKKILLDARDAGEFDGTTYTPSVDDEGNLSWTNDKGKVNPPTKNVKGYSPSIAVKAIAGGKQFIITDYNGSQTVDILNGKDGAAGKDGINGTNGVDGQDGYSPSIDVKKVTGGHQLIITNRTGNKTVDVMDGINGQDGVSPIVATEFIDVGTKVTISDKNGSKSFVVFNGEDGVDGANGQNGVSPTVTVTDINGGHRVTITDAIGTKTFDVMDGTQEISEAVKQYISTYMHIGETEPTSGPVLWFDTSPRSTG